MNHLYLLLFFFLTACSSTGTNETEEIEPVRISYGLSINSEDRKLIQQKNKLLVTSLKANDWQKTQALFSEQNLEAQEPEQFEAFVKKAGEALESAEFELFDEFQVKTKDSLTEILIESEKYNDQGINNYEIYYGSICKESYVSLLVIDGESRDMMLTAIYGKYGNDWKVDQMYVGELRAEGRTAPELYQEAEEAYVKGELYKAFTLLSLSQITSDPGGVVFSYEIEEEMYTFYDDLFTEVANELKLPSTLDIISTSPALTDIQIVHTTDNKYFPLVSYITHLNITDNQAIEKECDELNEKLPEILPGYTWHFDNVLYQAIEDDTAKTNESLQVRILVKPVVQIAK